METREYTKNQMEEVCKILQTEFQGALFSTSELANNIKNYFEQDFCVTSLASKMKGFLKTHTGLINYLLATKVQSTLIS
jgi:hypothetical protein